MSRPLGTGIPRLQELAFLTVAHAAVARGATFDEIRRDLVAHMLEARLTFAGTGNTATFQLAKDNPTKYVSNASQALKELMRLGMVVGAKVPSEGHTAAYYRTTTFALTDAGREWAALLETDQPAAMDGLFVRLRAVHPQFAGILDILARGHLYVPLAGWSAIGEPTRERYLQRLAAFVAQALAEEPGGWTADGREVADALVEYLSARVQAARARNRPDPYPRNRDFINACEEALVKLAFTKAGTPIDYITYEVMRRWLRDLQVANFSYHVPGPAGLRTWATAELPPGTDSIPIRRVGDAVRDTVIETLGEGYEAVRRDDPLSSPWVPIYRLRAAVCFRLGIPDRTFDRALVEFARGERGHDAPYAVNLDLAQYGVVPPTERPLRITTNRGPRDVYTLTLVPRSERSES